MSTTVRINSTVVASEGGGGGGGGSCAVRAESRSSWLFSLLAGLVVLLAAGRRRVSWRGLRRRAWSGLRLLGLGAVPLLAGCGLGSLIPLLFIGGGGGGGVDSTQPDDVGVLLRYGTVFEQAADGSIVLADSLGIELSLINQGDDVIPDGRVIAFYLSTDKSFSADDDLLFLELQVSDEVPEGRSVELEASVGTFVPLGVTLRGPMFLIMQVNASDETELEDGDLNNVTIGELPVQIYEQGTTSSGPDFTILQVRGPTSAILSGATNTTADSAVIGGVAELSAVVTNLVEPVTSNVTLSVHVFLSEDTELSTDDDSLSVSIAGAANTIIFPAGTRVSDTLRINAMRAELPATSILSASDDAPVRRYFLVRIQSSLGDENVLNNLRSAEEATFIYDQWLQASNGAILPATNDGDPIALSAVELRPEIENELLPTGRQRLLSFEIPERNLTPEQSQILLICQSTNFDPILEVLNPSGKRILASDDSNFGNASTIFGNISSLSSNRTFFVAVSSFDNVGGTFDMIVDINPREAADGGQLSPSVVVPHPVGNLVKLPRGSGEDRDVRLYPFQVTAEENEFFFFVPANMALGVTVVDGVNLLLEAGLEITYTEFLANQAPTTTLVDIVPSGNDLVIKPQGATNLFFNQQPGFVILVLGSGVPEPGQQQFTLRFDYLFFRESLGDTRFDDLSEQIEQAQ